MRFRITLVQNLPNRDPSAFDVTYTFTDGRQPARWFVTVIGPDRDTNVLIVDTNVDLLNQRNVETRTLNAHYPTMPITVDIAISSVQPALAEESLMATSYAVNIHMSDDTVDKLHDGGYLLYGFKGVQTTIKGGAPLVWFQTSNYSGDTSILWQEQYKAYTSNSAIIPNGRIDASRAYDIDLEQTLEVTGQGGTGRVVHGGTKGAISILNMTEPPKQFTCGISQVQDTGGALVATPLCAFPLYGHGLDVMAPIQRVLLTFSTLEVNTGTVIFKAYSQGILIDLTGVTSRDVEFDINAGWSWGGAAWAKRVPANADLVPLLIDSKALSGKVLEALNTAPAPSRLAAGENGAGAAHGALLQG